MPFAPVDHGLADRSVAVVLGTRPEIVKLAGLVALLGPAARVIHTGQHYSAGLSDTFLATFAFPTPDVHLDIGGTTRGQQIGTAVAALDDVLRMDRPAAVVVQGDTNTVVAGALAANANDVPLIHVEAGLRSHDRSMPEEHNRVVTDHLADLLLAPTEVARGHLLAEGIPSDRIEVTGNTVVEALLAALPDEAARAELRRAHGDLPQHGYALATFHRPENVDEASTYATILRQLADLPLPVVLPLHPRARARATSFGLDDELARLHVVEPLAYAPFLGLAADAALLVSDSGGVQEEASVLKRPVIVVRNSTERPEVLGSFATLVAPGPDVGVAARAVLGELDAVLERLAATRSPYGEGEASRHSLDAIVRLLS